MTKARDADETRTVSAIFRIGKQFAAPFPLRPETPDAVRRSLKAEADAAQELLGRTGFPTPEPVALGEPGFGYPLPWSVQTWLAGAPATDEDADSVSLAHDLAEFIQDVRRIDTRGRTFNGSNRGGDPRARDAWMEVRFDHSRHLVDLIASNQAKLLTRETRVLMLACAPADAHDLDSGSRDYQPLVERACAWGGEGTPEASEYCATELGALQGVGMVAARMLIADALDLRHRLPALWAQVQSGEVRAWQARKVAQNTPALSYDAARDVDTALAGLLTMLPWSRFQKVLAAAVLQADPAAAADRERRAQTGRCVWASDTEDGLKLLVARASSGDVTWFLATVNRIADILLQDGDLDPVGTRRARAIGILAQPAQALQLLLARARSDDQPADDEVVGEGPVDTQDRDRHVSLDLAPLPAGADLSGARPRVVLHFHLSDATVREGHGVVRPEHGDPLTLGQFRDFLTGAGCTVQVRPVLDPAHLAPVDGYETPPRLREAMRLRHPAEVFPYGTCTSASLISTTLCPTCRCLGVVRLARPAWGTSAPSAAPATAPSLTVAGDDDNRTLAATCFAHRPDTSSWSLIAARRLWGATRSLTRCGTPRSKVRHRRWPLNRRTHQPLHRGFARLRRQLSSGNAALRSARRPLAATRPL